MTRGTLVTRGIQNGFVLVLDNIGNLWLVVCEIIVFQLTAE